MGLIPGPGGSHQLRGNWALKRQLLSLRALESVLRNKPPKRKTQAPQLESSLSSPQLEKALAARKTQHGQKKKIKSCKIYLHAKKKKDMHAHL